jgi:hypothetical protein
MVGSGNVASGSTIERLRRFEAGSYFVWRPGGSRVGKWPARIARVEAAIGRFRGIF